MFSNYNKKFIHITNPNICPHCNTTKFTKYGFKNNNQRYKCKNPNCLKTFSNNTNRLWSYSKKDITLWNKFIVLLFNMHTLDNCSKELGITISTAHSWRIKVLNSIDSYNYKNLKGEVEIKRFFLPENFKGNRKKHLLPKTREKIHLIAAIDNCDGYLMSPVCRYSISKRVLKDKILNSIDVNSKFFAYHDRILTPILCSKPTKNKYVESFRPKKLVLPFINNLKIWLKIFRGVATKYLKKYISLYKLIYTNLLGYKFNILINILSLSNSLTINEYKNWAITLYY